jgi:hypothetical protein
VLIGDLIYTLGWALWTGVVIVVFVQIWPEIKRRQFKQALDAYEATVPSGPSRKCPGPGPGERGGRMTACPRSYRHPRPDLLLCFGP